MDELILYGFKGRSRSERVLWALQELNLTFKMIRLDFTKGENRTNGFLSLNPDGKVPTLVHNKKVLTESMAICYYLCNLVDNQTLLPKEINERYLVDQRIFFAVTEIEPYVWLSDLELFIQVEGIPDGISEYSFEQLNSVMPQVELWLMEHSYIAGDQFSLADILYYHLLSWVRMYDVELPSAVEAYLNMLEKRPAFPGIMAVGGSPVLTG